MQSRMHHVAKCRYAASTAVLLAYGIFAATDKGVIPDVSIGSDSGSAGIGDAGSDKARRWEGFVTFGVLVYVEAASFMRLLVGIKVRCSVEYHVICVS